MRVFALTIFIIHTCFEIVFGLNAFISGGSSSQSAEQLANQSIQMTISGRFLGSALLALGVLGAVILFGPGVQSSTAKLVSIGFATFHLLGTIGVLIGASSDPTIFSNILTLGAFIVHAVLAIGFVVIALRLQVPENRKYAMIAN